MFKIIGENRYAKMHIFIVNGRYVAKFFNALVDSIKTRSEKKLENIENRIY
jgi:hypothetical protein